ncbi:hypothetical protein ACWGI8_19540 [Streptomyces sp. NPDC054841]
MRNFARAAATAALTVTAIVIPLTGTAMAAPTHSPVTVNSARHFDDWCGDFDHRRHRHHGWDRRWNRWGDDCRHRWDRWDRRGTHRAYWHNSYGRYRNHDGYRWDYERDCYRPF